MVPPSILAKGDRAALDYLLETSSLGQFFEREDLRRAIAEREQLLVTSAEAFHERYRVDVRTRTEAIAIDRASQTVRLRNLETGEEYDESYDRVLLSPGAEPVRPRLPGIESQRVFGLRNIPDLDRIMSTSTRPNRAVRW